MNKSQRILKKRHRLQQKHYLRMRKELNPEQWDLYSMWKAEIVKTEYIYIQSKSNHHI